MIFYLKQKKPVEQNKDKKKHLKNENPTVRE